MPKSYNQKMKILYLMKAFLEETDEEHVMSMKDILSYLESYGIKAERKSIYDDVEALKVFGFDIIIKKEKPGGYYLASRDFELPELKLLVDAVQASKFITTRKSNELIKKLETLASKYEAKSMQRQVYVANRIKTMNESVYYTVDDIHNAISAGKKIVFQYCEWTTDKKLIPRKNGELYDVSPWSLVWDDENYYLIGFDNVSKVVKHYRVDKIKNIKLRNEKREGKEHFEKYDAAEFSKKTFGMFSGEERNITLRCENKMIGVILDRFGTDISIINDKDGTFHFNARVKISNQFFGWLTGIGADVKIVEPADVVEQYTSYLQEIMKNY